MATFLDLVNLTRLETAVSTTPLTTLAGVIGKNLQVKTWVNRSWMDVQRKHPNWKWMRSSFTFPTVASQQDYTPAQANATNYGRWLPETFRSYVTGLGYTTELYMGEWEWDRFKNLYVFGAQRTVTSRQMVFAIKPDKSISLGPLPNATGYTVTGDYFTRAIAMSVDTDVPALPDQFVDIIMHKAKVYFGQEESAAEVFNSGTADYKRMLGELEDDQWPDIDFGGAML